MVYRSLMAAGALGAPMEVSTSQEAPAAVECAHPLPWHHLLAASALGSLLGGIGMLLIERGLGLDRRRRQG